MNETETKPRNYVRAAAWISLSPILFLMAAISTVESLAVYYAQLACFAIVSIAGLATGVGYALGKSWSYILAKYIKFIVIIYFVGCWLIMALLMGYKMIFGAN